MKLLKTPRLIVRKFEETDFDALLSMMTDAETMKYTGFKEPQTPERIRELIKKWQVEGAQELGVWAVVSVSSGEFIGWSMLKPTTSDTPELGYMFGKEHWGKGYGSELAKALVEYARRSLKLEKIVAATAPENIASVKVLEKAGMKRVGVRKDGGVVYEITLRFSP